MSWNLLRPDLGQRFVGIENFIVLLKDPQVVNCILNTLYFTGGAVFIELIGGLGLALLLSKKIKGVAIFRSLLMIPLMVAPVVTGFVWRLLLDLDFGPIFHILRSLGFSTLANCPILSNRSLVIPTLILVDAWISTPLVMLVLLAGLESIPSQPYEAASVDGASRLQLFWYITLPLLKSAILVALLIRTINAIRFFDIVFIMTGGGPGTSSEVMSLYNYRISFIHYQMGYGAAVSFLILLISMTISFTYIRLLRR